MTTTVISIALALAAGATGGVHGHYPEYRHGGGRIVADAPGYGWGFPNGNPDGYGWWDHGDALPLAADRTAEYYFPRFFSLPPSQMFLQSYYNPYLTRGQRYIAYTGCGGWHPAGCAPTGSAMTPVHPYNDTIGSARGSHPPFSGRVEAPPVNTGGSGLTPDRRRPETRPTRGVVPPPPVLAKGCPGLLR